MPLRAFLELFEAHGGGEVPALRLAEALIRDGDEARSALRAHGVVRDAPRAESVPCDGLGCAREVREPRRREGSERRFVAVCTRDPAECETVEVTAAELAQERISREAFVAALQRALKVAPPIAGLCAAQAGADVVSLGEQTLAGEPCDVFLAWRGDSRDVRALLGDRAATARATRLLLLTTRSAEAARMALAANASRVILDALADVLLVRDGQLAERPRLAVAPRSANAPPALGIPASDLPPTPRRRSPALEGLPDVERFNQITLYDTDQDDLVGVVIGGRSRRMSCVDFGLATVNGRRPTEVFVLLKTVCRGNGNFQTRAFGSASNGKRLMSELRSALRETFGLEGDPFEKYSRRDTGWKPKFRALADTPAEIEAMKKERGIR